MMKEQKTTEQLTKERGENYGHPYDHFQTTEEMYNVWLSRRAGAKEAGGNLPKPLELCLRHIVYFVLDKLARAAENPMHLDNFDDIQGYASLWIKCQEKHNESSLKAGSDHLG
jgi:hypothetical protein